MGKYFAISGIVIISLLCLCSLSFAQETLTITTYYPSPYGSYNQLTTTGNTYLATTTGSVGIGTTGPTQKLDVVGGAMRIVSTGSGTNNLILAEATYPTSYRWKLVTTDRGNAIDLDFYGTDSLDAGTLVASMSPYSGRAALYVSGNVGLGTTGPAYKLQLTTDSASKPTSNTWTITSDRRLKKNIRDIEGALDKMLRLHGVTFQWKEPEKFGDMKGTYMGLIGQEVEKIIPEWVGTDQNGYKNLTIGGFEALTAEAIKELKAENDALKSRVKVLESKLKKR